MTLTEFLLARIAEDEEVANATSGKHWRSRMFNGSDQVVDVNEPENDNVVCVFPDLDMERDHVARWDPARVLAECEAKRRIVKAHTRFGDRYSGDDVIYHESADSCSVCGWGDDWRAAEYGSDWPCYTLKALTLPYADHPDFDPAWKV